MKSITIADYSDLPPEIRVHVAAIEDLIGDVDGKTIAIPTDDDHFLDDGTVDADAAVLGLNGLIAALRPR